MREDPRARDNPQRVSRSFGSAQRTTADFLTLNVRRLTVLYRRCAVVRCALWSGRYPPSPALRIRLAVGVFAAPMQSLKRAGNSPLICRANLGRLNVQSIARQLSDRDPFGTGLALGRVSLQVGFDVFFPYIWLLPRGLFRNHVFPFEFCVRPPP